MSLVKFSRDVEVPIKREPIGWPVYNKILSHRNAENFCTRQYSPIHDVMNAESNFLPALDKVGELLEAGYHENCALSLFFFSDGQSTDHTSLNVRASEAKRRIRLKMKTIASRYGNSLTVTLVGLGDRYDDFSVLEVMASAGR